MMTKQLKPMLILLLAQVAIGANECSAQRESERLGRGVVAIANDEGDVFISWRLLQSDAGQAAFNVYRKIGENTKRMNDKPIADITCFVDRRPELQHQSIYFVRPVIDEREGESCMPFVLTAQAAMHPYLSVPLQTLAGYRPNDAAVGDDLDGDDEYEIVLHQVGRGRDNSQAGITTEPILEAYRLDGTMLWRINLGRNIREGAHYTQFMVYDLDGDGRAEVACKTADGTIDGQGNHGIAVGNVDADGRDGVGRACALDIDPRHRGLEMWGKGQGVGGLFNVHGARISGCGPRTCNMGVWWDGDLRRELLDGVRVTKWDYEAARETPLLDGGDFQCISNNGNKSNPCLCADVFGDWREEIIAASRDGKELRVFTTTIATGHRLVTLMQDPIYRLSVAWQNVSYNQPAHLGFFLGHGMTHAE